MKKRWRVYSLRDFLPRIACSLLFCLPLAACMHAMIREPAGFSGTPRKVPPAEEKETHIVALDPGHGGYDCGASAIVKELEVCERTADLLYAWLEQDENFTPVRTRPNGEDRPIKERAKAATDAGAELLLSIHANSDESTRQSHGFECFPTPPGRKHSEAAMRAAVCIAEKMAAAGHRLRGENGIRFAYYNGKHKRIVDSSDTRVRELKSFGIVERPDCPAVLIEQCFLTNYNDVENWAREDGCVKAARVYYEAICEYFGTQPIGEARAESGQTPADTNSAAKAIG